MFSFFRNISAIRPCWCRDVVGIIIGVLVLVLILRSQESWSYNNNHHLHHHHNHQGCGVGVIIPRSPGFGPESESVIWRRLRLWALSVSSGLFCNFVAVYLTFVQFILQLKFCLYTIVHLVLEEFKISLKPSLSMQSDITQ